jgi:TusA-related sulfurtransferase
VTEPSQNTRGSPQPEKTLDVTGLFCPEPVFRTKMEISLMVPGTVLEVLADDPAAEDDITRWSRRSNNSLLSVEKKGRILRFLIRKGG